MVNEDVILIGTAVIAAFVFFVMREKNKPDEKQAQKKTQPKTNRRSSRPGLKLAEIIDRFCADNKMTNGEMMKNMGFSDSAYYMWKHGKNNASTSSVKRVKNYIKEFNNAASK